MDHNTHRGALKKEGFRNALCRCKKSSENSFNLKKKKTQNYFRFKQLRGMWTKWSSNCKIYALINGEQSRKQPAGGAGKLEVTGNVCQLPACCGSVTQWRVSLCRGTAAKGRRLCVSAAHSLLSPCFVTLRCILFYSGDRVSLCSSRLQPVLSLPLLGVLELRAWTTTSALQLILH